MSILVYVDDIVILAFHSLVAVVQWLGPLNNKAFRLASGAFSPVQYMLLWLSAANFCSNIASQRLAW